jgi:RecB family endonuclease NucS
MIFKISPALDKADKILPASFTELNIWERRHIEEWIRRDPEVLGEDLLILTIEFDRFVQCADRLDILALDRIGNLVVVELKRDTFAGYAGDSALIEH